MAIEQLGESLLSQARDRNKKSKKKAKLFTGLMLGVKAGNALLRRQAEKRANEFWKSNQGVLTQRTQQFDKGINFWKDDKAMLKKYGFTEADDWKLAKRQERYNFYKQTDLGGKDPKDVQQFRLNVDSKIEDDLLAYGKKRELYQNFKNIGRTEEDIKKAKINFEQPVRDSLNKGVEIIKEQSSVGGLLLGNLGLFGKGKSNLEEVTLEGQTLMLPMSYGKDRKDKLALEIRKNTDFTEALSSINNSVTYEPLTSDELKSQLGVEVFNSDPDSGHAGVLRNALSGEKSDRLKTTFANKKYKIGDKEHTIYNLYINTINKDTTGAAAELMASQILGFAEAAKIEFENSEEIRKLPPAQRVRSDDFYVDLGIKKYIENTYSVNGEKVKIPDITFNNNEVVTFLPQGTDRTFNKPLGAYINDFRNLETKENSLRYLTDFKESTDDFTGKEEFITTLQDIYNNKFVPKTDEEENPLARTSSFFQFEKKFKKNPLSN